MQFFYLLFELLINLEHENYYPKKMEIPKSSEQKSESKGMSPSHVICICLYAFILIDQGLLKVTEQGLEAIVSDVRRC